MTIKKNSIFEPNFNQCPMKMNFLLFFCWTYLDQNSHCMNEKLKLVEGENQWTPVTWVTPIIIRLSICPSQYHQKSWIYKTLLNCCCSRFTQMNVNPVIRTPIIRSKKLQRVSGLLLFERSSYSNRLVPVPVRINGVHIYRVYKL